MSFSPRFSLGTVQPGAELCPVYWALLDTLERSGCQVQSFRSSASLAPVCGVRLITGQSQRHLDSWMMSKATCREIFEHGAQGSDLSIVAGRFDSLAQGSAASGSLDTLSNWLELPSIAVVDVSLVDGCRLPSLPARLSGIVLDCVKDNADGLRWKTNLEAVCCAPVLGWLHRSHSLSSLIGSRDVGSPCRELCQALGERLQTSLNVEQLVSLARQTRWTPASSRVFARQPGNDPIRVALALDEAFHGYFADTLDALEARGACICDFSPLRCESLPPDTDVVYLAGSRIDAFANALSHNVCLKQALHSFVQRGGRIYAEGAGLAYLCQRLVTADGRQIPMAGLLPAMAVSKQPAHPAQPAELTFGPHVWLGESGTKMRGYLSDDLELLPAAELTCLAEEESRRYDLVGDHAVIGSRMQVDFAGQPHLLSSFFRPRLGALVEV